MRFILSAVCAVTLLLAPSRAFAQTSLHGFGALPIDQLTSFGDSTLPIDFGGRVSLEVARGVEVLGEFGRIGNVLPAIVRLPLSFSPVDFSVSAFYGEGGVRLIAAPRSVVSPYVEGTAGVAHLKFGARGLGSTTDALVRAASNLVDTRDPIFGAGGGLLLRGGPMHVDLGYRYKRIVAKSAFSSILGLGQQLQSHQLRIGLGVRF